MVPKTEVGDAHAREWRRLRVASRTSTEKGMDTVDEIYHTRWDCEQILHPKKDRNPEGNDWGE